MKEKFFVEESAVFTFPYQTNGNHAMEPSTFGHVNLRNTGKMLLISLKL